MPEDLVIGDDEEPAPTALLRPVVWGALALVLVALGSFVVERNSTKASYSAADFSPYTSSMVARPLPTQGMTLGLGNNLLVGQACPALAAAPGVLAVSFRLVNWGQANVVVTSVSVVGSAHGLHSLGSAAGGSCESPAHGAVGGALMPGGSQLYRFFFRVPADCPATLKNISLGVRTESLTGTTTTIVRRDVGRVWTSTCPQAAAAS
jgi:hypothetical protein